MSALDISSYAGILNAVLVEAAKYLALLFLVVLALRLWRQIARSSGTNRQKMRWFAIVASILAAGVGYYSLCNSLGRLYLHYGVKAVNAGSIASALRLFQTSAENWKSSDALGGEGICALWTGETRRGLDLLSQAAKMRKRQSAFEQYYEGLYFFYHNQWDTAAPLLSSAAVETPYRWNAIKLIAAIELEKGSPEKADQLMAPFAAADVTDYDQAYVVASLDLWKGQKQEARTLAEKYDPAALPPFWSSRFQKLDAQLQARQP
ncbi:MAG: hypothetical protein ACRED1_01740 [Limisphaerales bacterium]